MEQLKKRGFQLVSMCPLCDRAEENLDHLLLHCHLIWRLGSGGLNLHSRLKLGLLLLDQRLTFEGWSCSTIRKNAKKLWMATPLCLFWAIWRERNRIVFDDECFSMTRLKTSFIRMFDSWAICFDLRKCPLVRILLCNL